MQFQGNGLIRMQRFNFIIQQPLLQSQHLPASTTQLPVISYPLGKPSQLRYLSAVSVDFPVETVLSRELYNEDLRGWWRGKRLIITLTLIMSWACYSFTLIAHPVWVISLQRLRIAMYAICAICTCSVFSQLHHKSAKLRRLQTSSKLTNSLWGGKYCNGRREWKKNSGLSEAFYVNPTYRICIIYACCVVLSSLVQLLSVAS